MFTIEKEYMQYQLKLIKQELMISQILIALNILEDQEKLQVSMLYLEMFKNLLLKQVIKKLVISKDFE